MQDDPAGVQVLLVEAEPAETPVQDDVLAVAAAVVSATAQRGHVVDGETAKARPDRKRRLPALEMEAVDLREGMRLDLPLGAKGPGVKSSAGRGGRGRGGAAMPFDP